MLYRSSSRIRRRLAISLAWFIDYPQPGLFDEIYVEGETTARSMFEMPSTVNAGLAIMHETRLRQADGEHADRFTGLFGWTSVTKPEGAIKATVPAFTALIVAITVMMKIAAPQTTALRPALTFEVSRSPGVKLGQRGSGLAAATRIF